jgi:ribosomal protein L31
MEMFISSYYSNVLVRCMTCPSLIEGTSFTFKNGQTFTVMQDISCKTKNLVYAIICSNCGEFYVGGDDS